MTMVSRVVDLSINNCTRFSSSSEFYKNNQVYLKKNTKRNLKSYYNIKMLEYEIKWPYLYRRWNKIRQIISNCQVWTCSLYFLAALLWFLWDSLAGIHKHRTEESWPPHVQHCLRILHSWRRQWADSLNWTCRSQKGHPVSNWKLMIELIKIVIFKN